MKHRIAYIFQQCLCNSAIQPNTSGLLSSLSSSFFLAPCLVTQVFPKQKSSPTSTPERTLWSSPAATHQSWVSSWQRPGRSQLRGPAPRPCFFGTFLLHFFLSQLDHREGRGVKKVFKALKMEWAAVFITWQSSQSSTEGAPLRWILPGLLLVEKRCQYFFFFLSFF